MKPLKRKEAWPEILADEINKAQNREFKYGSHDCCMFSNRIVKAYSGRDIAKKLKGYTDAESARTILKEKGKGTLLRTMMAIMKDNGCKQVKHVSMLRRGDVCMAKVEIASDLQRQPRGGKIEWAVGIVLGTSAVFASDGIVMIPIEQVLKGWHCG